VRNACWSALWYGFGVSCKESVAALPLLIATLRYLSTRRVLPAVSTVVPHGLVLLALLAWRYAILGGLGGYWFSAFVPDNLLTAAPTLAAGLWGRYDLAVVWLFILVLRRPSLVVIGAVGYSASVLPFVLGVPFPPVVNVAARLSLTWALLLLSFAAVPEPSKRVWNWASLTLGALLLVLQCTRFSVAHAAAVAELPPDASTPPAWKEPQVILSSFGLWYAWDHQNHPEPKAELHAYVSRPGLAVDRALRRTPEGAPDLGVEPRPFPLDQDGIRYWADPAGRFHLRVSAERLAAGADPRVGRLFMAIQYQNGKTHWSLELPVERQHVDFPLSYSLRSVILFSPDRLPEWPIVVWHSPFFIDPYPPEDHDSGGAG